MRYMSIPIHIQDVHNGIEVGVKVFDLVVHADNLCDFIGKLALSLSQTLNYAFQADSFKIELDKERNRDVLIALDVDILLDYILTLEPIKKTAGHFERSQRVANGHLKSC
jgi:hypothetical protein